MKLQPPNSGSGTTAATAAAAGDAAGDNSARDKWKAARQKLRHTTAFFHAVKPAKSLTAAEKHRPAN